MKLSPSTIVAIGLTLASVAYFAIAKPSLGTMLAVAVGIPITIFVAVIVGGLIKQQLFDSKPAGIPIKQTLPKGQPAPPSNMPVPNMPAPNQVPR